MGCECIAELSGGDGCCCGTLVEGHAVEPHPLRELEDDCDASAGAGARRARLEGELPWGERLRGLVARAGSGKPFCCSSDSSAGE